MGIVPLRPNLGLYMDRKIKSKRNGRIEILRFVFAFIVLLHHSRYLLGDDNCYFLGGSLAVEFFFIVSGYLMTNSLERINGCSEYDVTTGRSLAGQTASFINKKIRAVLPQFPIAWIIGFIVVVAFNKLTFTKAIWEFIEDFWELALVKMTGIYDGGLDGVMWYISSMLICMTILYPLLRKYPDMMKKIWCPLLSLMLLGMMCAIDGHPRNPSKWYGIIYKGNIRAFAELCIGIWSYDVVKKIKEIKWTQFARILFELIQTCGYIITIIYMYRKEPGKYDYFFLMILTISIMLSFAQVGILSDFFNNGLCALLGRFSTAVYFSHIYYAQNLNVILSDSVTKHEKTIIYLVCSFVTAFAVEGLSLLYKKVSPYIMRGFKAILVQS